MINVNIFLKQAQKNGYFVEENNGLIAIRSPFWRIVLELIQQEEGEVTVLTELDYKINVSRVEITFDTALNGAKIMTILMPEEKEKWTVLEVDGMAAFSKELV